MHDFKDKRYWRPELKKYRASVSANGNVVDIIDVHNQIIASFTLSIKFGKVALEEKISHSLIIIPVDGDAESFSPFTYDFDTNTISAMIMKTDGTPQTFSATLDDLMKLSSDAFHIDHDKKCKCEHSCEKSSHKPDFDKPFEDKEDDLDSDFFYPNRPNEDHDHCDGDFDGHHKPHKPHRPLIDPYVTKSQLDEESKKRQFNDMLIRDMIGENKHNKKSIFSQIYDLSSTLQNETERLRHENKIQKERLEHIGNDFEFMRHNTSEGMGEIRKMLTKEIDSRTNACSELFRLSNLNETNCSNLKDRLDETNSDLRKEAQKSKARISEARAEILKEQNERINEDERLKDLIRIEETNRFNAVKEALCKVDIEYRRAAIAEEEIKQDLHSHVDIARKNDEIINKNLRDLEFTVATTYVKRSEDGGISLKEDSSYKINETNIAKVEGVDVKLGDSSKVMNLYGVDENPLYYNKKPVALLSDIPSLDGYVTKDSYNEALNKIKDLQDQLLVQIENHKKLEETVDALDKYIQEHLN